MRLPAPLCPWPPSCAPRACCVVRTRHLDVLCVLLESQAAAGQMEPHCWGGWLLSIALRYVADRAGPSPLCELPLPRRCRRRTAPPVAVAGSVGPFVCCCWMGDRRRHPRGWPELPVRAGCYRSRSGMSQTALVRRRCASCRCGLPPFLPSSLRPSAPPSLAPSVPPPPTTASPVAPPLLQRCGHGRAGQTCDVHEDVSHMRGRRPVLLLDVSARDRRDNARERERAN